MKTIIKPLITEKTLGLASRGWYTFASVEHARKEAIAREISDLYKVTVVDVRTVSMHGKVRRAGKRPTGVARPDWKKALVRLVPGQHIDAFEVTQSDMEKAAETLVEPSAASAPESKEKKGKK